MRDEKGSSGRGACLVDEIKDGPWHDVDGPDVPTFYQRFIAAIRKEGPAEPDFARGAALQVLLDKAEASAGEGGKLLTV